MSVYNNKIQKLMEETGLTELELSVLPEEMLSQYKGVGAKTIESIQAYSEPAIEKTKDESIPKFFTRKDLKSSHMISGYGAGRKLITKQFKEDFHGDFDERYIDIFYKAQEIVSPMVVTLKEMFQELWNPEWTKVSWRLPDGFVTDYRPMQSVPIKISPFGIDMSVIASVILETERSTALGVNIIHSVDGYVARQMVVRCNKKGFKIWPIHDGFNCHPNFAHLMLETYKEILSDILESELLEDIIEQITGVRITSFSKQFKAEDIMNSGYAIC